MSLSKEISNEYFADLIFNSWLYIPNSLKEIRYTDALKIYTNTHSVKLVLKRSQFLNAEDKASKKKL